jgi:hypothetical protein
MVYQFLVLNYLTPSFFMILAIRALRATIFAFNASIWVSRAALASVTDDEAVIVGVPVADDVA